jgi:hypothetical protein
VRSLVGVVPFDYALDRRTGGRFKPLGVRSECRSETAPGCFEVVIIEATATGSGENLCLWCSRDSLGAYGMLPNLKCGGVVVNEFRVMRGRKTRLLCERDGEFGDICRQFLAAHPVTPIEQVTVQPVGFATDSPLEGDGFEPSVPGQENVRSRALIRSDRGHYRRRGAPDPQHQ